MFQFALTALLISIVELVIIAWFALSKWSSKLHTFLFFSCIVNLAYDLGCYMQLQAKTEEAFLIAFKLGYFGRVWIGFALMLFSAEMCNIHLSKIIKELCVLAHVVIYYFIFTIENNDLYYVRKEFVFDGDFPKLLHTGGPLYYLQMILSLSYAVFGVFFLIRAYLHESRTIVRKRYKYTLLALLPIGISYVMYAFKLLPITHQFDLTIVGLAIGMASMLIAILRYNILDAKAAATDFVMDELSQGIIVEDMDNTITYYNEPAKRLFPELSGTEDGSETGKNIAELLGTEAGSAGRGAAEPLKISGRVYTPRIHPLIREGKRVGTLYSLTDNSDHYRYIEELREQKRIADSANEAKSQFLANMSHEIRTPINAVLGMNELVIRESAKAVKDGESLSPSVDETFNRIRVYSGNIETAGANLLSIINDILDFSKIEAGKMELAEADYSISSLLNDICNMNFYRARKKGLGFVVDVDETIPDELYGDRKRVRQIIVNLVSNAIKYTEKGCVYLTVQGEAADRREGGMLRLSVKVKDTGMGIKSEDQQKLFRKFQRVNLEQNSTIEGTGLGLAITRQLVDMMGGTIDVESEYGKGSVFTATIDQRIVSTEPIGDFRKRFEESILGERTEEVSFLAPDAEILVVDDTRMNIIVATGLLEDTRIGIDSAESGMEALELTQDKEYDLILLDQRMPEMDGIETLRRMRNQPGGANTGTPVICLTADAIAGAREHYMAEGFTDYLTKPIDSKLLKRMLVEYLPREKVISPDDEVIAEDAAEEPADEFAALDGEGDEILKAAGIDKETGLRYTNGSEELYEMILSECEDGSAEQIEKMQEYLDAGDMANYAILAHSLKSTSRSMGAAELSEMAAGMEDAADSGEFGNLKERHEELMAKYRVVLEAIRRYLKDKVK